MKEILYKTEFSDEKMRFTFFFYSKLKKSSYKGGKENEIPDASVKVDIPGLLVFHDFVTEDEEKNLVEQIDAQKWNRLKRRRVQHYGYEFIYGKNRVDP
jgi:alkylated DNA repair protein alkB family protein 8